jgi:hypothetical protein
MILGNKCDMEDKRAVSKERGEAVSIFIFFFYFRHSIILPFLSLKFFFYSRLIARSFFSYDYLDFKRCKTQ